MEPGDVTIRANVRSNQYGSPRQDSREGMATSQEPNPPNVSRQECNSGRSHACHGLGIRLFCQVRTNATLYHARKLTRIHSKSQYTTKLKVWGIRKNCKAADWEAIGSSLKRQTLNAYEAHVSIQGRPISNQKLKKELSRYCLPKLVPLRKSAYLSFLLY